MLELLSHPETYVSLAVLTVMEIVLGIDNIVFITILCGRLPKEQQVRARRLGLFVALFARLALLLAISWVVALDQPLFTLIRPFSGKDLILVAGGMFLLYKATHEIFVTVEHPGQAKQEVTEVAPKPTASLKSQYIQILAQVIVLDIVFSLDSVITAVGMVRDVPVMVVAMVLAIVVMMIFAGPVGDFVERHPSVRILALAFLVLIGVLLIVEGTGQHVSKGYVYSAMGFSMFVQLLNLRHDARQRALQ